MGKSIRLKKGFDIQLKGVAFLKIAGTEPAETFAIKPTDFKGIYMPKLVVQEGDSVKAGSPLFHDKKNPKLVFTAPVSGEVVEIRRGPKRKLLEVIILADKEVDHLAFSKYSISDLTSLSREKAQEQMLSSGVWPNLIQRPFGIIANPLETPKSIFISAFDTHPLAPAYSYLFKGQDQFFQAGIQVLKKFTSGLIHLNLHNEQEASSLFAHVDGVEVNKFTGPHPSGCVGVQIHHIDPINKGDVVWTINPFGVIQIGKLFLKGVYDASRLFALVGSEVKDPQFYKGFTGSSIKKWIENNVNQENVRYISGNVLTGSRISSTGFVGFYDHMITVIPEGNYHEFLGWFSVSSKKLSFHRALGLLSFLFPKKEFTVDSNMHGEPRAFVQTGVFERMIPMDILPTHLIKSIIAEDYDEMEALGIYEVIEEDFALCEFVDVSKHNVQLILREGIDLMLNS